MDRKHASLFEPLRLNAKVTLKNRIVKAAQWFIYTEQDGSVGDRLVNFYSSIARGALPSPTSCGTNSPIRR